MKDKRFVWTAVSIAFAFAAGAISSAYLPRVNAQSQYQALPPIFQEGARLLGPTGSVEIHEIMGDWIRVKSLSALAHPGEELWIHAPALPGAWTIDTAAIQKDKQKQ